MLKSHILNIFTIKLQRIFFIYIFLFIFIIIAILTIRNFAVYADDPTAYTGCLSTNSGLIYNVKADDSPLYPCGDGDPIIEGGGDITSVIAGAGLTGGGTSGALTLSVSNGGITESKLASSSVTLDKIANNESEPNRIASWTDDITEYTFTASGGGSTGNIIDPDITIVVPQGKAYYYHVIYSGYMRYLQSERVGSNSLFVATWRANVLSNTTPVSLGTLFMFEQGLWSAFSGTWSRGYEASWLVRLEEGNHDIQIGIGGNSANTMNTARFGEQHIQIMRVL